MGGNEVVKTTENAVRPRMVEMDDCRWVQAWVREGRARLVVGEVLIDRTGTIRGDLDDGSTFSLYSTGKALWGKAGSKGFSFYGMGYSAKINREKDNPYYVFIFIGDP